VDDEKAIFGEKSFKFESMDLEPLPRDMGHSNLIVICLEYHSLALFLDELELISDKF
jgi:hypothetical protein